MAKLEITRRKLVQASVAATILPFSAQLRAGSFSDGKPKKLHWLLVDRNIPESVRFGTFAGMLADEVIEFDGDLTRLWRDELRLQWPNGPQTIGGLTKPGVRMVLEQLGRDHRARIVFSAEHQNVAGGIRHDLNGCSDMLEGPDFCSGPDWVAEMARYLESSRLDPSERKSSLRYDTRGQTGLSDNQHRLVTWVLAPVLPRNQRPSPEMVSL
jgi:hypothetical protein